MARTKPKKPGRLRGPAQRNDDKRELSGDTAVEAESINNLKKQIRDIQRLLQGHKKLPADIEVAKERELQSLRRSLNQAAAKKERSRLISKYHKLRFFERQKAFRRLKKTRTTLNTCKDPIERDVLERSVHIAQIDLNYALYHPLLVPYSALFGVGAAVYTDEPDAVEAMLEARRKNEMWVRVESATASGEVALKALREEKKSAADEGGSASDAVPPAAVAGDDASDDGFFE